MSFVVSCSGKTERIDRALRRGRPHLREAAVRRAPSVLVVVTSPTLQNGHASGATVGSVDLGWVYTWRAILALWIVSLAEPLFRHPLMANAPKVKIVITPKP